MEIIRQINTVIPSLRYYKFSVRVFLYVLLILTGIELLIQQGDILIQLNLIGAIGMILFALFQGSERIMAFAGILASLLLALNHLSMYNVKAVVMCLLLLIYQIPMVYLITHKSHS